MGFTTPSMPQFTMLSMLPHSCTTLPQLLPTLSMPQLLPMLSMLPQPTTPQLSPTLMRSPHTPTPMLSLMTTPSPASTLRNSPMVLPTLLDLTLLLFLMVESNMSSTLPTDMMDMSLMSPMREPLSTQRPPLHTRLLQLMPQPQLITLKSEYLS